ncbi:hypothetical protein [Streptosporangium sp. NPDC006007]|uniref:hypothetical protein n=1 Tax=Streptosporangium sp. NPDC006007 TaxID=3154575 RepID=UPI0033AAFC75
MGLFGTEAFRRLRELRESYDGPIDQDGNPAPTGRAAEILAALRETTRGERDV